MAALVGAVVILIAVQAATTGASVQGRLAQSAALLALHDQGYLLSVSDDGFHPDAEVLSCGRDAKKLLGNPPRAEAYGSGRWSAYDGLFDLLLYQEAYRARWANLKRRELLANSTGALWRASVLDCLQLPGVQQFCKPTLERRLQKLGANMPDKLPRGSPSAPVEPRTHQVICAFVNGLSATKVNG